MKEPKATMHLTDDHLRRCIEDICEPVDAVPLAEHCYNEVPLTFIVGRRQERRFASKPVCVVAQRLPAECHEPSSRAQPLYTFYNWLRSGLRLASHAGALRFEVFKGCGLTLPAAYEQAQQAIGNLYSYDLMPNDRYPGSPYCILAMGAEQRIGGAAYISYALPDLLGYQWLSCDAAVRVPELSGFYVFTPEFCELAGICSHTCCEIVRLFLNPFRVSDLQLMKAFSENGLAASSGSLWASKAGAIAALSCELAGFNSDLRAYALYLGMAIGSAAAALINNGLLHNSLTDHCQNITLAGELTEFDWTARIHSRPPLAPNLEPYLYSQVLLFANHVRCFAECMGWIGVDLALRQYGEAFLLGLRGELREPARKKLLHHFATDPFCADIKRMIHSPFSAVNLQGCDPFISILHELVQEVL